LGYIRTANIVIVKQLGDRMEENGGRRSKVASGKGGATRKLFRPGNGYTGAGVLGKSRKERAD